MINKVNFFIAFYGDNYEEIYKYLFCKGISYIGRGDIAIVNSHYFYIIKNYKRLEIAYTEKKIIRFL